MSSETILDKDNPCSIETGDGPRDFSIETVDRPRDFSIETGDKTRDVSIETGDRPRDFNSILCINFILYNKISIPDS